MTHDFEMKVGAQKIGRVLWGRTERPLTVFVPWDCGHHCPFCTTKKEYHEKYPKDRLDELLGLQKDALRRILPIGFVNEIVLTGGEPLADIPRLKELIGVIRDVCGFCGRLYVNTSLNFDEEKTAAAYDYLKEHRHGLDGISVSLPYADVNMMNARGFELMKRFERRAVRVNSVVRGCESADQIRKFIYDVIGAKGPELHGGRWGSIIFRKDYTTCDQSNLNDCSDPMMATLMGMPDLSYYGSGGCLVCRNDVFLPLHNEGWHVTYHRGTELTSLRYGDLLVINDLIVKQDGELRYDWCEGTRLPLPVVATLNRCRDAGDVEGLNDPDFSRHLTRARSLDSPLGCRESVTLPRFLTSERCG